MNQSYLPQPHAAGYPANVAPNASPQGAAAAARWVWGVMGATSGFEARGLMGNLHVQIGEADITERRTPANEHEMWLFRHGQVDAVLEPPSAVYKLLSAGHATEYVVYRRSMIDGVMLNGWAIYRFAREIGGARSAGNIGVFALTEALPEDAGAVVAQLRLGFEALCRYMPRSPDGDIQFTQTLSAMIMAGKLDPVHKLFDQQMSVLVSGPTITSMAAGPAWQARHDQIFMKDSPSAAALTKALRSSATFKAIIWPSVFDASLHQPAYFADAIPATELSLQPGPLPTDNPPELGHNPESERAERVPSEQTPPTSHVIESVEPKQLGQEVYQDAIIRLEKAIQGLKNKVFDLEDALIENQSTGGKEVAPPRLANDDEKSNAWQRHDQRLKEIEEALKELKRRHIHELQRVSKRLTGQRWINAITLLGLMGVLAYGAWALQRVRAGDQGARSPQVASGATPRQEAASARNQPAEDNTRTATQQQACQETFPLMSFQLDLVGQKEPPSIGKLAEDVVSRCFEGVPEACQKKYRGKIEVALNIANYPKGLPAHVALPYQCENSINTYLATSGRLTMRASEYMASEFSFGPRGIIRQPDVDKIRAIFGNPQVKALTFFVNCRNQSESDCSTILNDAEAKIRKVFINDVKSKKIIFSQHPGPTPKGDVVVTADY